MADEEFGPYRLQEVIGRGGMGVVYRAFDTRRDRIVALKRLPHDLADDESFQARFRRESKLVARLSEPHIIPIHDFGEIDGQLYLDMRLVDGQDLSKLITDDGGRLDPEFAVDVIGQVAAALGAAHDAGLMHRDIKPSNVLVTGIAGGDRSSPFAYLVDFGIARAMGTEGTNLTQTTDWFGTVAYMAPERISGSSGDARSDIYSLACLLYQCVIGNAPFTGEALQVLFAHVNNPPPSASATRGSVPAALDAVIKRGMAKNPDDRFQTAGQFASAARAAMRSYRSEPTLPPGSAAPVRPAGPPDSVPPTAGRHAGPPQSFPPGRPLLPPTSPPRHAGPPDSVPPPRSAGPADSLPPPRSAGPAHSIPPVARAAGPPHSGPRPSGVMTSGPMPPRPAATQNSRLMTVMVVAAVIVVLAAIIAVVVAVNGDGDAANGQGTPTPTVDSSGSSSAPTSASSSATSGSAPAGWSNYKQFSKLIGTSPGSTGTAYKGATCQLKAAQSDVPGMLDQVVCDQLTDGDKITFMVGRFSSSGAVDDYTARLVKLKYDKRYWRLNDERRGLILLSPASASYADVTSSICGLPTFLVDFYTTDGENTTSTNLLVDYWQKASFPDTTPAVC